MIIPKEYRHTYKSVKGKFGEKKALRLLKILKRLDSIPKKFIPAVENQNYSAPEIYLEMDKKSKWYVPSEKWLNLDHGLDLITAK